MKMAASAALDFNWVCSTNNAAGQTKLTVERQFGAKYSFNVTCSTYLSLRRRLCYETFRLVTTGGQPEQGHVNIT